ncbi:hypothetical protein [Aeromonas jandaei]|uniref:hypothetical protein n=1 Tax=Aeromonas jandaei TaxID=650 RepID=UPI003BA04F0B
MNIFRAEPLSYHIYHDVKLDFMDRLFVRIKKDRPDFNRRMFDEDFTRFFDLMSSRRKKSFEIVSNDDELMHKLLCDVNNGHTSYKIEESIHQLVKDIVQSILWFGVAYFFIHEDAEQEELNIHSISPYGIVRLLGAYIQWIPKRHETLWNKDSETLPREIRILNSAKVMRFDMPKMIKRMLSSQNRILVALDKNQLGNTSFFPQVTHESPKPTNYFIFQVWKDIQDRALFRATQETGWNGRVYDSKKCSDFFTCHRLIRFRRNQILLANEILTQLSSELSRVGRYYNPKFSIKVTLTDELPNLKYLNELAKRLECEEVGFKEIMDYCYKR